MICHECGRSFSRKCDLDRHVNNTHGKATECLLCGKKLKSGNRRDVRVRHLIFGCLKFKESFENHPDFKNLAKKHADEFFDVIKNSSIRSED